MIKDPAKKRKAESTSHEMLTRQEFGEKVAALT